MYCAHFSSEIVRCEFSEITGLIVISLSSGDIDSFLLKVENEGNVDYDEATEKL